MLITAFFCIFALLLIKTYLKLKQITKYKMTKKTFQEYQDAGIIFDVSEGKNFFTVILVPLLLEPALVSYFKIWT